MKNTLLKVPSLMQRHERCTVDAFFHSSQKFRMNAEAGLTMMELLVVIIIVGIMSALAAPSFSSFIANNRISSDSNDLLADLMQARSTAVSTGYHVIVCASTDGQTCSNNVSDWGTGRIIFIDKNNNGSFDASDNMPPSQTYATPTISPLKYSVPSHLTVSALTVPAGFPCGTNCIDYFSYGSMLPTGKASFTLSVNGASQQRFVCVDYSGRPSVLKSPPSSSCP